MKVKMKSASDILRQHIRAAQIPSRQELFDRFEAIATRYMRNIAVEFDLDPDDWDEVLEDDAMADLPFPRSIYAEGKIFGKQT